MAQNIVNKPPPLLRIDILGQQELTLQLSHEEIAELWCRLISHGSFMHLQAITIKFKRIQG